MGGSILGMEYSSKILLFQRIDSFSFEPKFYLIHAQGSILQDPMINPCSRNFNFECLRGHSSRDIPFCIWLNYSFKFKSLIVRLDTFILYLIFYSSWTGLYSNVYNNKIYCVDESMLYLFHNIFNTTYKALKL